MTSKGILNYFIDCGLIITFLLSFITGNVKFPEGHGISVMCSCSFRLS